MVALGRGGSGQIGYVIHHAQGSSTGWAIGQPGTFLTKFEPGPNFRFLRNGTQLDSRPSSATSWCIIGRNEAPYRWVFPSRRSAFYRVPDGELIAAYKQTLPDTSDGQRLRTGRRNHQ